MMAEHSSVEGKMPPLFARGPLVIQPLTNPLYLPRIRTMVDKWQNIVQSKFGRTLLPKSPRVKTF